MHYVVTHLENGDSIRYDSQQSKISTLQVG